MRPDQGHESSLQLRFMLFTQIEPRTLQSMANAPSTEPGWLGLMHSLSSSEYHPLPLSSWPCPANLRPEVTSWKPPHTSTTTAQSCGPLVSIFLAPTKGLYYLGSISFFFCNNFTPLFISSLLINNSPMGLCPCICLHTTMPLHLLIKTLPLTPTLFQQLLHFSAPFNPIMSEKSPPHLLILLIDLKHNFLLLLDHFHQHMTIHSSHYSSLAFVKVTGDASLSSLQHSVWLATSSFHLGSL